MLSITQQIVSCQIDEALTRNHVSISSRILRFELSFISNPNLLGFLQVSPHQNRIHHQQKKGKPIDQRPAVHT